MLRRGLLASLLVSFGAYVYLQFTFGLDIHALMDFFLLGFDPSSSWDESAYVRQEQFFALLEEWSKRPFFGHGHGAAAWGSIRSFDQPWAYELSYVALLFHTGIVGFAIYAAAVIWIYRIGLRIIRSCDRIGLYMVPALVGPPCFLIANATNPYLEKFDYIWVIFLPVALINYWLLTGDEKSKVKA